MHCFGLRTRSWCLRDLPGPDLYAFGHGSSSGCYHAPVSSKNGKLNCSLCFCLAISRRRLTICWLDFEKAAVRAHGCKHSFRNHGRLRGVAPSKLWRWNSLRYWSHDSRRPRTSVRKLIDIIIQCIRTGIQSSHFVIWSMLGSHFVQVFDHSNSLQLVEIAIRGKKLDLAP